MNTAQSQELCHVDDLLQGLLNGLAKERQTKLTFRLKKQISVIHGRVHQLLNTNPVFKAGEILVPKGSNSPVDRFDETGAYSDVYRPFADVLVGFTHAVAVRATNLRTGEEQKVAILTVPLALPNRVIEGLVENLFVRGAANELRWSITNRAEVVARK